jgi:hypothetical protein
MKRGAVDHDDDDEEGEIPAEVRAAAEEDLRDEKRQQAWAKRKKAVAKQREHMLEENGLLAVPSLDAKVARWRVGYQINVRLAAGNTVELQLSQNLLELLARERDVYVLVSRHDAGVSEALRDVDEQRAFGVSAWQPVDSEGKVIALKK